MIIFALHNHYQQPGGEDQVFYAETKLLEDHGHRVVRYETHNEGIERVGKVGMVRATIWNQAAYRDIRAVIRREKPDVAHFHNTFPLISPAAYYAARIEGVPIIQTLHNYRLLCSNALFFRQGRVCEDCLGRFIPWPGVVHACYRNSRSASGVVAGMLITHRLLRTWQTKVDRFVALSEFARKKFIQGGLPSKKIVVKPNFLAHDPGVRNGKGDFVLFAGRLSLEKGLFTLFHAWVSTPDIPLKILGDGPLMSALQSLRQDLRLENVEFLGRLSHLGVLSMIKQSRFVVFPSECYENFPMGIIEAFACGVPVIASRIGSTAEILKENHTGLHFTPGDPQELSEKVRWCWEYADDVEAMGFNARKVYEINYTPTINLRKLIGIYEEARSERPASINK